MENFERLTDIEAQLIDAADRADYHEWLDSLDHTQSEEDWRERNPDPCYVTLDIPDVPF